MTIVTSECNQGGNGEKRHADRTSEPIRFLSFLPYSSEQYRRFRTSIFVLVARPATLSVRDTQCRTSRRVVTDASYP